MRDSQPQSSFDNPVDNVNPETKAGGEAQKSPNDIVPGSEIPPAPEGKKETNTCTCKPDQTPWWKHALELAAVIVGAFVALIYWNQLTIMNRLLCQMARQYPELKKSAQAAKEAADVAKDSLNTVQRACVSLGDNIGESRKALQNRSAQRISSE